MRKILVSVLMPLIFLMGFSNSLLVKSVNSSSNGREIIISLNSSKIKPIYRSNYDSRNQLIFLEIDNAKGSSAAVSKKISTKYAESVKMVSTGKGTGIFIKHRNNLNYKINYKGNEIKLTFTPVSNKKNFTIVIDSGHGGKDPGAVVGSHREKDIALGVAKYLQANLKKDFNVIMTRDKDEFIALSQRPKVANAKKADMFISLHVNAATNTAAKGIEVFYYSKTSSPYAARVAAYENSFGEKYGDKVGDISKILGELEYKKYQELSAKLARGINDSLAKSMNMTNRGIHGANFAVLRGLGRPKVIIPGVLVELGFITNTSDRGKIVNKNNQKIMADKIAEQVRAYY
ncbi:MAG: N-acetylmuramoyl-L-alanine amidase family protein [Fusobacteriaceae bacterium]